jgi:hypothetical protein
MFTNVWKFLHYDKQPLFQSLSIPLDDDENYYLHKFQGLLTEKISVNFSNASFMLNVLERENQRADIFIYVDSYECPWHKGFEKLNIPHYVQVKSINIKKRIIMCDDPYLNTYNMELPFKNFFNGCKTIRIFSNKHIFDNRIDIDKILYHINSTANIKQMTTDIISFAKRLLLVESQKELFDYMDDVYLCSNVRVLKFIADSRYGLSYLFDNLNLINDKKSILAEIATRFELCGSLFEKLNHFYIKIYYRSSDLQIKLQSMHDKLIEIAKIENDIFLLLNQSVVQ